MTATRLAADQSGNPAWQWLARRGTSSLTTALAVTIGYPLKAFCLGNGAAVGT
jgi:hypothetical protein